jgi:hypothetical protein
MAKSSPLNNWSVFFYSRLGDGGNSGSPKARYGAFNPKFITSLITCVQSANIVRQSSPSRPQPHARSNGRQTLYRYGDIPSSITAGLISQGYSGATPATRRGRQVVLKRTLYLFQVNIPHTTESVTVNICPAAPFTSISLLHAPPPWTLF